MALLDKMVQHCCGDCQHGHGKSTVDYSFHGNDNSSEKNTKPDMIEAIDHLTDLNFPVHGYTDQRTYLGTYKYVPVVESPGVAFIVRYENLDTPITSSLVQSWPLAVVVVVLTLLSGMLFWILVSESAIKSIFIYALFTLSALESFIAFTETFVS